MKCEEALLLISGHIDNENTPEEERELQAHLSGCAECRNLLKAYEDIDGNVAQLNEPAPEGLAKGVMYRIDTETGKKRKPRRWFIGPGTAIGAVAAVLVLLVGTGVIKLPGLSGNTTPLAKSKAEETQPPEVALFAQPMDTDADLSADMILENNEGVEASQEDTVADGETETKKGTVNTVQTRCKALSRDNAAVVLLLDGRDKVYLDTLRSYSAALDSLLADAESQEQTTGETVVETTYAALRVLQAQLSEQDYALFYPSEDYTPADTDMAYIVLNP